SRLLPAAALVWVVAVAAAYYLLLPSGQAARPLDLLPLFFQRQLAGFLVVFGLCFFRWRFTGKLLPLYLVGSTVVLVLQAHDSLLVLRFTAFAGWYLLATQSLRLLLRRLVGEEFAGWGVASAALLAVLVPASLGLALLGWVRPLPVGLVAVSL